MREVDRTSDAKYSKCLLPVCHCGRCTDADHGIARPSNPSNDFQQRYDDLLRQQAHGVDWIKWKWLARDLLVTFQERHARETFVGRSERIRQLQAEIQEHLKEDEPPAQKANEEVYTQEALDSAHKRTRERLAKLKVDDGSENGSER